ncbi:MAG: hypothetical protein QOH96_261 [Blastocatellia bacterium]|nr:hypothetical protein [Blastocatellia bacterium]
MKTASVPDLLLRITALLSEFAQSLSSDPYFSVILVQFDCGKVDVWVIAVHLYSRDPGLLH